MRPWELYLGDCVRGMRTWPDRSVDHVITDPPYSRHVHAANRRGLSFHNGKDKRAISEGRDLGFNHLEPKVMRAAARQFGRLAKRWVLVFSDIESSHLWRQELERAGLEYIRTGLWRKVGGAPQFTGDRPAVGAEAIVIAHQPGRKRWNGGGKQGIWDCPIVVERGDGTVRRHTTPKPLRLMEALVSDFTDRGDLVLDAFAGSGTTGVAALKLGRRFAGFEMDAGHFTTATGLLAGTGPSSAEQPGLFQACGTGG